jgi:hypothetical protein
MPQWMQDLTAGWPMIRANLPTFFVVLVLILGAVWIVVNWSYSGVLAMIDLAHWLGSQGRWVHFSPSGPRSVHHFPEGRSRVNQEEQRNGKWADEKRNPYPTRLPPPPLIRKIANNKH